VVSIQLTPTRQVNLNFNGLSKVLSLEVANLINALIIRGISEAGVFRVLSQHDTSEDSFDLH
jgi:hypothetical protein